MNKLLLNWPERIKGRTPDERAEYQAALMLLYREALDNLTGEQLMAAVNAAIRECAEFFPKPARLLELAPRRDPDYFALPEPPTLLAERAMTDEERAARKAALQARSQEVRQQIRETAARMRSTRPTLTPRAQPADYPERDEADGWLQRTGGQP